MISTISSRLDETFPSSITSEHYFPLTPKISIRKTSKAGVPQKVAVQVETMSPLSPPRGKKLRLSERFNNLSLIL